MARPKRGREIPADAVLEAASEVFASRGYAGATLDRVAETLGVTRQAVLGRYPSKRELFVAVLDRDRRWAEALASDAATEHERSPFASLSRFLGLGEEGRKRVRLQHVLQGEAIAGDAVAAEYLAERNDVIREQVIRRVERASAEGILAPGWNTGTAATAIMALMNGLQALALLDPGVRVDETFERAIAAFIAEKSVGEDTEEGAKENTEKERGA